MLAAQVRCRGPRQPGAASREVAELPVELVEVGSQAAQQLGQPFTIGPLNNAVDGVR